MTTIRVLSNWENWEFLPQDLAVALAPSAGLRNRLVHEYEAIDDTIVIAAVPQAQDLYPQYIAAVERQLQGNQA
jgi:uncharacterized protein YutE (UPF0331/DUF86 family)